MADPDRMWPNALRSLDEWHPDPYRSSAVSSPRSKARTQAASTSTSSNMIHYFHYFNMLFTSSFNLFVPSFIWLDFNINKSFWSLNARKIWFLNDHFSTKSFLLYNRTKMASRSNWYLVTATSFLKDRNKYD